VRNTRIEVLTVVLLRIQDSWYCHSVTEQVVPDFLKECGAFTLKVKQSSKNRLFWNCLTLEDEGTMVLQNIMNHSPSDTVSHPGRPESYN
jgi:hypothetical protein